MSEQESAALEPFPLPPDHVMDKLKELREMATGVRTEPPAEEELKNQRHCVPVGPACVPRHDEGLTLDEYQTRAASTATFPPLVAGSYPALGLCGEAGEFAEKLQHALFPAGPPKAWDAVSCALKDVHRALGMAAEAGKECERVKKVLRDKTRTLPPGVFENLAERFNAIPVPVKTELVKELSDCGWYYSQIAKGFDMRLSEVATINLDKLAGRAARGTIGGSGDNR